MGNSKSQTRKVAFGEYGPRVLSVTKQSTQKRRKACRLPLAIIKSIPLEPQNAHRDPIKSDFEGFRQGARSSKGEGVWDSKVRFFWELPMVFSGDVWGRQKKKQRSNLRYGMVWNVCACLES